MTRYELTVFTDTGRRVYPLDQSDVPLSAALVIDELIASGEHINQIEVYPLGPDGKKRRYKLPPLPGGTSEGQPVEPPSLNDWTPHRYVTHGTAIGWHCYGGDAGAPAIYDALGARLPSAKVVQSGGDLWRFEGAGSRLFRIIDHDGRNLEWFDYDGDPIAQAEARWAILRVLASPYHGDFDYLEVINEQGVPDVARAARLGEFSIRMMELAERDGYRLALFSFSTGNPEPGDWDAIAETGVLERAAEGGHAIALHAYGRAYGDDVRYHIRRYRDLYERHVLPRQLDIPLFLTELAPEPMLWGDELVQWVRDVDALLAADPYVAGAHLFTVAGVPGWEGYSEPWRRSMASIAAWTRSVQNREN